MGLRLFLKPKKNPQFLSLRQKLRIKLAMDQAINHTGDVHIVKFRVDCYIVAN